MDAAWSYVVPLAESPRTEKALRLAAIEAASNIRPQEALDLLYELSASEDEDIVAAASEALAMAEGLAEIDEEEDDDEEDYGELGDLFEDEDEDEDDYEEEADDPK